MDIIRRLREITEPLPTMGERDAALAEYAALVALARHHARGLRKFGLPHTASIGEISEATQQLRDFLGIKE
jgi:hypothetical protein